MVSQRFCGINLKSDGERSIKAFRDAVAKFHGGEVMTEEAARGESQPNRRAEETGTIVRGFTRVMKEHLEDKAKMKITPEHVMVQWMVRRVAMVISRCLIGKD